MRIVEVVTESRQPGEYVYHASYVGNNKAQWLKSLIRHGLKPSEKGYSGAGTYFAYAPDEGYYHVTAEDSLILRVRWADLVKLYGTYPQNPKGIERDDDEIIVPGPVPSSILEVEYFEDEWWDLKSALSAETHQYEARTNPEQNPKPESGFKELASIAKTITNPENWAISMTGEPKLGINPQVGVSEDTPKGIYFYPLNYALSKTRYGKLPWGNDYPYIQLFQYDRSREMTKQTQVDPAELKQALSQYCPKEVIQSAIDEPEYDGTPYWFIYDCLSRLGKSDETNVVRWNKVLRDLGFTSVYDDGNSWIAYNEPTQGVVLDPRVIKQHKTIVNKKQSVVITPAVIEQSIFETMDMELARNRAWQAYDPDGSKLRAAAKEYAKKPEFKQYYGKPGTEEIFNKIEGWGRYGARQLSDIAYEWFKEQQAKKEAVGENFADGKVKGKSRPGRVKRAGASCAGSVTDLRAKARKYGGEKGKMYHWCANMKGGK